MPTERLWGTGVHVFARSARLMSRHLDDADPPANQLREPRSYLARLPRLGPTRVPSLRARLVLLVVVCIAPCVAFSLGREYLAYRDAVTTTGEQTLALTRSMTQVVEQELQARIAVLQTLAQSPLLTAHDMVAFRKRAEAVVAEQYPGASILLLAPDGHQLMNTAVPPETPLPKGQNIEMLREVVVTGRPRVSDLFVGRMAQRPTVAIDVPVKRADGSVAYALSLNPNIDDFAAVIRRQQLPQGWFPGVLDRQGILVARTQNPEKYVGQPASPQVRPYLLAQHEGIIDGRTLEGVPVLTVFSHGPTFGWAVVIGVPQAEFLAPAVRAATRTLAIGGGVLLVGLALALFTARRITQPIASLRHLAIAPEPTTQPAPSTTGLRETDEVAQALRTAEASRRRSEDEERRTRGALHESRASFRQLFEDSPLPKWVFDVESLQFLAVNRAALDAYGYAREEFLAMHLGDLGLPGEPAGIQPASGTAAAIRSGDEWRCRCKDGRVIDVDIFAHDLLFDDRPARMAVAIDVTARKMAEDQLRHAQKMEAIGQLTGGLAHDFNNLLLIILGNLGLLLDEYSDNGDINEYASQARDAAQRGADLTRSLLAFARRQPLRPERVDINDLVASTTRLLNRTLGERITISLDRASDIWSVVVDHAQLQAALANLATNARDAMPHGGRLTIATANRVLDADYVAEHPDVIPGDYALLEVSDTGIGMPPEVMAKIFEPFFTTKPRGAGTGLGLSMVFGFIKQSGGHITVYSEPGVGTTFRLYLPRDKRTAAEGVATAAKVAPAGSGERVLVVEDDGAIRRLVVRQLTALGYRVLEAENTTAAIALFERGEPIDLLFTDVVMAGTLDGRDLAHIVLERWPATRVILTSGFSSHNVDHDGTLPATVRLLTKPYQREDLAGLLRDVLDGGASSTPA